MTEIYAMEGVGIAFCILGFLLARNERVARWGLSHGRARIWIKLLGEERALKLTRWFFGPVVFLLGALVSVGGLVQWAHA